MRFVLRTVVVEALEDRGARLGGDVVDTGGRDASRAAFGGLAADDGRLPYDRAGAVVHAGVLFGQVDVHVTAAPVLQARSAVRACRIRAGHLDQARLVRVHGRLHQGKQRVTVYHPAVRAARNRDLLPVGARVGALGARGGVGGRHLVHPCFHGSRVERDRLVRADDHPAGHHAGVERRDLGPGHGQTDVHQDHAVGRGGGLREHRVGGQHVGLRQLGRPQFHLGVQHHDGLVDEGHHRVGGQRGPRLFGDDDELALLFVERHIRVLGSLPFGVERLDGGMHRLRKAALVVRGKQGDRLVMVLEHLVRPLPRIHFGHHGVGNGLPVQHEAGFLCRQIEREAESRDREPVVGNGFLEYLLHLFGGLEGDVGLADDGMGEEPPHEHDGARHVHQCRDGHNDAQRDAEHLERRTAARLLVQVGVFDRVDRKGKGRLRGICRAIRHGRSGRRLGRLAAFALLPFRACRVFQALLLGLLRHDEGLPWRLRRGRRFRRRLRMAGRGRLVVRLHGSL